MKLFKKRKKEADGLLPKESLPLVIRAGGIRPTTCKVCHTVYQASKEHIHQELDFGSPYIIGHLPEVRNYTKCPICGNPNQVEFEEVSEG